MIVPGSISEKWGILAPVGDSSAVAAAVIHVPGTPALRLRLEEGAEERARASDVPVVVPMLGRLIDDLVYGRRRKSGQCVRTGAMGSELYPRLTRLCGIWAR